MKNRKAIRKAIKNLKKTALRSLDAVSPQKTNKKSEAEMNILIAYHEALQYTSKTNKLALLP